MAVVKDPVGRARKAKTPLQAARLREELEMELALNTSLDPAWEREADEAVTLLNDNFDDLDSVDIAGTGRDGWTPSTSRGANKGLDPPAAAKPKPAGAKPAAKAAGAKAGAKGSGRQAAAKGKRGRGRSATGGRLLASTGIPAAGRSASRVIMQTLGLLLGLSLLYLLLTNSQKSPAGKSAVELFTTGIAGTVAAIVQPIDPLNAAARAQAAGRKPPAGTPTGADVAGGSVAGAAATPIAVGAKAVRDAASRIHPRPRVPTP